MLIHLKTIKGEAYLSSYFLPRTLLFFNRKEALGAFLADRLWMVTPTDNSELQDKLKVLC